MPAHADPGLLDAAFAEAEALRHRGQLAPALAAFESVLARVPDGTAFPLLDELYRQALNCQTRLGRWSDAEALARAAIARLPGFAIGHQFLGEALIRQDRTEEAKDWLRRGLALDPELTEARSLLRVAESQARTPLVPRKVRSWPTRSPAFDDAEQLVQRYLLRDHPAEPFVSPATRFMTIGSCFANRLESRLRAAGYETHFEPIGEEVNSTFANRYLLEWVETGDTTGVGGIMEDVFGPATRGRLRRAIAASDVVVVTLGLAACFFENGTGAFAFASLGSRTGREYLNAHCSMRTTSVEENVDNILAIVALLERIAGRPLKVVLTVSPVPLGGTTEFSSAIIADCVSKSTLRLACHAVTTGRPGSPLLYWPSFEIVRWLGPHFGPGHDPAFGKEDGNTRHVSAWLVDLVVSSFLRHHAARDMPAAAAAAAAAPVARPAELVAG